MSTDNLADETSGLSTLAFQRVLMVIFVGGSAMVFAGLYYLAHTPYRPPQDMSTLLGGPELQAVYIFGSSPNRVGDSPRFWL